MVVYNTCIYVCNRFAGLVELKCSSAAPVMLRGMCGKSSLKKLRTEGGWGSMPSGALEPLEAALTVLEEDLKSKKEEKKDMHRDWAAPGMLEHII